MPVWPWSTWLPQFLECQTQALVCPVQACQGGKPSSRRYQTHTDLSHLAALLRSDPHSLQVPPAVTITGGAAKARGAAHLLAGSQAASSDPGWCSPCSSCSPFSHLSYTELTGSPEVWVSSGSLSCVAKGWRHKAQSRSGSGSRFESRAQRMES